MGTEHTRRNRMKEIRIEWNINGKTGGGRWIPEHPDTREKLKETVDDCNSRFGNGTHWIVERDA